MLFTRIVFLSATAMGAVASPAVNDVSQFDLATGAFIGDAPALTPQLINTLSLIAEKNSTAVEKRGLDKRDCFCTPCKAGWVKYVVSSHGFPRR